MDYKQRVPEKLWPVAEKLAKNGANPLWHESEHRAEQYGNIITYMFGSQSNEYVNIKDKLTRFNIGHGLFSRNKQWATGAGQPIGCQVYFSCRVSIFPACCGMMLMTNMSGYNPGNNLLTVDDGVLFLEQVLAYDKLPTLVITNSKLAHEGASAGILNEAIWKMGTKIASTRNAQHASIINTYLLFNPATKAYCTENLNEVISFKNAFPTGEF